MDEFIQRSEFNYRPGYFKDKNVTLNNFITEKILAIEANNKNELIENKAFNERIRGIKEQKMRDELYYQVAYNKIKLTSDEILDGYKKSIREYKVQFYTLKNQEMVEQISNMLKDAPVTGNLIMEELGKQLGKKPENLVKYLNPEHDIILDSLFKDSTYVGEIIGPLKLDGGSNILLQVMDWTDYPVIGEVDQRERWDDVVEKLHLRRAKKDWNAYQANIMHGKKIEFNVVSFNKLAEKAIEYYNVETNNDSLENLLTDLPAKEIENMLDKPFFTIDGKVWTVEDFKTELMAHPLVFRAKNINSKNFQNHFKLAVVDMIRDFFLTKDAYSKSLDSKPSVNRTVAMWKDSFLASAHKKTVINSAEEKGIINKKDETGTLEYWESYVKKIQKKYSDLIEVNFNVFNEIELSGIDLLIMRSGVPYPIPFPRFPMFTNSGNLHYVKKQETQKL